MSDKIWFIDYVVNGKRVCVELTQSRVDLARKLAINPELVDCLDIETMTLKKEEALHGTNR